MSLKIFSSVMRKWRVCIVRVRTDVNDAVYNITYIYLQVVEYVLEDLLLCDAEVRVCIVRVRTDVNDAVHVKIQVVKLRNLLIVNTYTCILILMYCFYNTCIYDILS